MGKPSNTGTYIVTLSNGRIDVGEFCCKKIFNEDKLYFFWQFWDDEDVIAWCKLSDIEHYKEKIIFTKVESTEDGFTPPDNITIGYPNK